MLRLGDNGFVEATYSHPLLPINRNILSIFSGILSATYPTFHRESIYEVESKDCLSQKDNTLDSGNSSD